jgi:hypothetical protein
MKYLLALTLLATPLQAQVVASWYRPVLAELGQIADTAHIEHYRCLLGGWRNDTLYVVAAVEPQIIAATALFISTGPCPPLLTVAEWHSHVPRRFTLMGEDRGSDIPPEAYCELSPTDRRVHPWSPLLQLLSVTETVSCAWVLDRGQYTRILPWPP